MDPCCKITKFICGYNDSSNKYSREQEGLSKFIRKNFKKESNYFGFSLNKILLTGIPFSDHVDQI